MFNAETNYAENDMKFIKKLYYKHIVIFEYKHMYTSFYIIWPQGEGNTKALNKKNKRRDPYDYQPQLQNQLHD